MSVPDGPDITVEGLEMMPGLELEPDASEPIGL